MELIRYIWPSKYNTGIQMEGWESIALMIMFGKIPSLNASLQYLMSNKSCHVGWGE
jgi:hypothetical protein